MISTHWTHVHQPQERELRLLDIVARQAADLLERNASADALRRHADNLLEADRYKNEFLATLAHELRNPLAPIQTGLTVLRIGKPDQAPRVLAMMERQVGHMVRMIEDLLDVSRISRGKLTLRRSRVELSTVIDTAVETSRPLISAANHTFTLTVPGNLVWLDVDATRVAQIISNLVNNAAKYTPPGGRIDLVAELVDQAVEIRVIDTGIGIAAAMLPRIFELFIQVDSATERAQSGLGVGLALAKQLAEMHGGSISAASAGDLGGSVFTLRLPIAEYVSSPHSGAHSDEHIQRACRPCRILVVDDNADAAEMLAMLLEQLGHTIRIVLESRQALAAALDFKPDVVFLDIGMPHLNGFDLARAMREQPSLQNIYFVALSGWGTEEDRAKSHCAGIDAHLTKPVMLKEVEDVLLRSIRK